jgi:hypothetical protein
VNVADDVREDTRSMREATGIPWRQIREWLIEHGHQPDRCAVATKFPEEAGWVCIILLPGGQVLRLDPTFGSRGDIRTQRAATTIAYWEEVDQDHRAMYGPYLAAAQAFLDADSAHQSN